MPIEPEEETFYVQDSRSFVGNSVVWWRHEGQGYTTNLKDAMVVTEAWTGRDTDKKWKCSDIDSGATLQFDMQLLRHLK